MLNKTLLSITRTLDKNELPYMIIGGYAVLFHGHARFTEDIDIVLGIDVDELDTVLKAVSENFTVRPEDPEQFVNQTNALPLAEKESGIRVDLIFSFLSFEREAIANSISASIENNSVNIVQAEELIIYKLLAGRPRDLDDIQSILNFKADALAIEKIESQVKELSVALGNSSLIQKWEEIYSDYHD